MKYRSIRRINSSTVAINPHTRKGLQRVNGKSGPAFLLAAASSGVSRIIKKAADQTAREDATR